MGTDSLQNLLRGYGIGIDELVDTAAIASGGGSTAKVYMLGARDGWIPGLRFKVLISTKEDVGCIEKAKECGVPCVVVNRKSFATQTAFNGKIYSVLRKHRVELAFLAGCNQEIYGIPGIYIPNNHPAPKKTDGGKGMYDIMAHEHVLLRIKDEISRYPHLINAVHRTCVDHHEAISRDSNKRGMDIGELLTTVWVDIPPYIINGLMDGSLELRPAAEALQKHVMKYEYMSIISNAMMAAQRVRDAKKYGIRIGGFEAG